MRPNCSIEKLILLALLTTALPVYQTTAKGTGLAGAGSSNHWSLRPLLKPAVPLANNSRWMQTPIDSFILVKLTEQGMKPSEPADKRTLIRRATFDLIGLPPTPEEVAAFLADKSPQAYERVVDRLLSSPRYGERWARHWMDVVHYAETHGNDQDRPRPNSWPYRDYLVRSFNDDKPYARFVEEQLAGDVLYPDDPQGIVATGFIATGPWDESSLLNIMEDTVDKKIARYLDRDDMVTTTMSTFVSTTVQCARCHNHKFDPIPQTDYYSLQAVFAGVDKAERPYDLDPKTNLTRQALLKQKTALDVRPKKVVENLLSPATQAEVADWKKTLNSRPSIWTTLAPVSFVSSNGATLTKLSDLSLLAGGTKPDVDTYTIVAGTDLTNITAVRLEVLADDSLPYKGPGRQDNGNLHLSEFQLKVAPKSGTTTNKVVALQNASADFNQQDWSVSKAIDGKRETAWGIYPEVGKSHLAVFETKESIGFDGGTTLTFVLDQQHGRSHLIGRFRLSVTTAPRPVKANPFPDNITKVLAIDPAQRTDAQKIDLAAYFRKEQIDQKLKVLPPPQLVYAAANDFTPDGNFTPAKVPRPIYLLKRGDVTKPGDLAAPGALSCVPGLESRFQLANPEDEGNRRAALAKWITDPKNVLTWRSIVNRIWHYHFGRGLVDSPNDFGRMGARPTHPELLDWLAVSFRDSGGSFKQLHKLIVTSSVFCQSSQYNPRYAKLDADNLYLWRMNRARLDAESVRDAVLQITGKLDLTMGGPSVKQFIQTPGIHVTPMVDYASFNVDSQESYRRSVYRFIFRTLPDPFMDSLDCADSSQLTAKRNTSVTSLQALAMLNNHFIVRQSEHFAERVSKAGDLNAQIKAAYELALGRAPTSREAKALKAYAAKHGMANTCRLILNGNEFMFVN
ncbi:MAG: DUF1553 domain-containing protein [Verrucomicrobia bacterium]|nr:DUF1553 domain-containing protein [Verrucomicrobiota bacterium]